VTAGLRYGPRTIPDLQFICPLRGRFAYAGSDGRADDLVPGQVLCIEPDIRHVFTAVEGGEMAGMHVELSDGSWAQGDYRSDPPPPRVSQPADGAAVAAQFVRCAQLYEGYGRLRQARCSAIASDILLALAESWSATATPATSARIGAMVAFIREHAVAGCSRHRLARAFGVTPEHVNALFKRELALTPTDVLNRERCRIAYHLLHDQGVSVADAAAQAGFNDPFYFSRVFTKLYQRPPSRAR
jgi:AraC-like DNA-binding protein